MSGKGNNRASQLGNPNTPAITIAGSVKCVSWAQFHTKPCRYWRDMSRCIQAMRLCFFPEVYSHFSRALNLLPRQEPYMLFVFIFTYLWMLAWGGGPAWVPGREVDIRGGG